MSKEAEYGDTEGNADRFTQTLQAEILKYLNRQLNTLNDPKTFTMLKEAVDAVHTYLNAPEPKSLLQLNPLFLGTEQLAGIIAPNLVKDQTRRYLLTGLINAVKTTITIELNALNNQKITGESAKGYIDVLIKKCFKWENFEPNLKLIPRNNRIRPNYS